MSKKAQVSDNVARYNMEPVERELNITEADAWAVVGEAIAELPPYLEPDAVTAESTAKRFGIKKALAAALLKKMVADKLLIEVERLNPKGGSHIKAYIRADKKTPLPAKK